MSVQLRSGDTTATAAEPTAAKGEKTSKSSLRIGVKIAIVVGLLLLIGIAIWVIRNVLRNRNFNGPYATDGHSPFLLSFSDNAALQTYFKRNNTAAPEIIPSGAYEYSGTSTIGLDLGKLKTGDLILSRFMRGKEKDQEYEVIQKLFADRSPQKTWRHPSTWRKFKHLFDKEAMHQYYTGPETPTHICMVGRVLRSPSDPATLSLDDIEIWNIGWHGREVLTLRTYMERYPCTMAKYWVAHLNTPAVPPEVVNVVEDYVVNISPVKYWFKSLGISYLKRSRGVVLANRQQFFDRFQLVKPRVSTTSVFSHKMLALSTCGPLADHVSEVADDDNAPRIIFSESTLDLDCDSSHLVELSLTDNNPAHGWNSWYGLDHEYFSCSGLIYAYLEAFRLVVPMWDALNLSKTRDGVVEAGNVQYVDIVDVVQCNADRDVEDVRLWQGRNLFDPTSRIRIMAPQTMCPCEFMRSDFQWADGVYIKFASRFYTVST